MFLGPAICKVSIQRTREILEIPTGRAAETGRVCTQRYVSRMFPSCQLNDIVHQFSPAKLKPLFFF